MKVHLEELVLCRLPLVAVAVRYQHRRVQSLGDVVDLSAVPDVYPQFRVVEVVQRVAAEARQTAVVEGVALARVARRCRRAGERRRRRGREKAVAGRRR